MYTDGFDELSDSENRPQRTYVSTGAQDYGKLLRENEKLKKGLEKEQFFNRLLDQELKDLKNAQAGDAGYNQNHFNQPRGASRGAFNFLLVLCLAMAGFIAYTLYFNKQYNLFPTLPAVTGAPAATPVVTDSVPTIISESKNTPSPKESQAAAPAEKKQPAAAEPRANANNTANTAKTTTRAPQPEQKAEEEAPVKQQPQATVATTPPPAAAPVTTPVQPQPQPVAERPVIARYIVSSKANFYNDPDENTLRSYFISPGSNKIVNALEEKNGFIYVEFKNDVGYVTKGWLSKADLTRQ